MAMRGRGMADDRTALFGERSKRNAASRLQEEHAAKRMEAENEERLAMLNGRVDQLKHITVQMGEEARDQNRFLDEMGLTMSNATGLMSSTIKKLGVMVSTGSNRHMCYLALFILFVFVVIYFSIRR